MRHCPLRRGRPPLRLPSLACAVGALMSAKATHARKPGSAKATAEQVRGEYLPEPWRGPARFLQNPNESG
ncbi:hypothetical protein B30_04277 [Celeribacter baekdonensis B30]|uniref:Uncharacterized protein n=1 Tax=Celeribacter baekdonensis B30 TaxID=1208323 RepID=K2JDS3_9RHOB|nr:hypothetical protein B30_04277 [Celeribacter baekdonensis B30]